MLSFENWDFQIVKTKAVLGDLEEIHEYTPTPTKPVFLNPSLYHNNHQHDRGNVTIQNYHAWSANYRCCANVVQVNSGSPELYKYVQTTRPDQEGNKLQRPNSGFIQHTPHEAQYTS